MPQEQQLSHRVVRNTNLPYISNQNPASTEPCFVTGSQDLLTSIAGYCERRPGFADAVESTPTAFTSLQRLFTWDRTDGSFIEMACDISGGNSIVYKRIVGVDVSFASIYTDTGNTTPFDFVVSNNTLYFSNGHVAKKWDPVNGVTNWGISSGTTTNGPNTAGTGASSSAGGGTIAWTNPTNVSSAVSYASFTWTSGAADSLTATSFSFAVSAGLVITGIQVSFGGNTSPGAAGITVGLLKGGNGYANLKSVTLGSSPATYTLGSSTDLWGGSWTVNDINASGFGVQFFPANNPSQTFINNVKITVYTGSAPTVAQTGTGSFSATTGFQYVACYGNSSTGHISSPTVPSASTGAFSGKVSNQVTVTASADSQVNQIHVFRSTDSVAVGTTAGVYFEIPNSPFSNTNQTITDSAVDTSLNVSSIAPTSGFNDPPPPIQGMVYFSGRVWGFAGNRVYFSGLEEIINGVPEESFVSGVAGNWWAFDQPVQALAVAGTGTSQTLGVFCGGRLYGITGNSLDTFRRFLVSNRRGCRNRACVSSLGGMVAWLDSAAQVWISDGNSLNEISVPIRPDLVGIDPSVSSLTFHSAGKFNWLVLSNGTKLFVYDIDSDQWMPPWNFACNHLFSGETAAGSYQLMAATSTKALQLSTSSHNDNGASYTPIVQTNLFSVVPDFGKRFSYIAAGIYDQPSRSGQPWYFEIERNNVAISSAQFMTDDDPLNTSAIYSAMNQTSPESAFVRTNGSNLVQDVWSLVRPVCRWISFKITGATADDALKIYGFFLAYKETR